MKQVKDSLERSGYLLESSLVRLLTDRGYFVEPNQMILDPRTGKSREIDLVAELCEHRPEHPKTVVNTNFVMEVVNNKFPIVLLTDRPSTPMEDFENHVKFICTPEPNDFSSVLDIYEEREPKRARFFSQYCAITPKKGKDPDFMASHPDDLYHSLQKLAEYIEEEIGYWRHRESTETDQVWRVFFWHAMLVLGGRLIIARTGEDGEVDLIESASGILEFKGHTGGDRQTTVVEFITADALMERLDAIGKSDKKLEKKLYEFRSRK